MGMPYNIHEYAYTQSTVPPTGGGVCMAWCCALPDLKKFGSEWAILFNFCIQAKTGGIVQCPHPFIRHWFEQLTLRMSVP